MDFESTRNLQELSARFTVVTATIIHGKCERNKERGTTRDIITSYSRPLSFNATVAPGSQGDLKATTRLRRSRTKRMEPVLQIKPAHSVTQTGARKRASAISTSLTGTICTVIFHNYRHLVSARLATRPRYLSKIRVIQSIKEEINTWSRDTGDRD